MLVVVTTDMTVPTDVKEIGIVVTDEAGAPYFARRWAVDRSRPVQLPASLGVRTRSPQEKVRVSAVAYRDTLDGHRVPFVLREATTTIPSTRVALLAMPLEWLGWGTTGPRGEGVAPTDPAAGTTGVPLDPSEFVASCAGGDGACATSIDEATLPTVVEGAGGAPAACFDPAACFNHVKPFRFTLTREGARCLATPDEPVSEADRQKLNLAVRARNGERWQWQVLDRHDGDDGTGTGWRFDAPLQKYEVPQGLCATLTADREEMQSFAEGRTAKLPERTSLGLFGTFRCDEVKYARLLGCGGAPVGALATGKGPGVRVDAPTVAEGTAGPGGGSTGGGSAPPELGDTNQPDVARTVENRPFFGCGPLEKIGTTEVLDGLDGLDGGLLVRRGPASWVPITPLSGTDARPVPAPPEFASDLYQFAGADLVRRGPSGFNAVHYDPQGAWGAVAFDAPGATLLRTVAYPQGVADVRAVLCTKDACQVAQNRVASWTFPGVGVPLRELSLGTSGGYPVVASFGSSLRITPSVDNPDDVLIPATTGFKAALQTERALFAQDGDRLRRFDRIDGILKESKPLPFPVATFPATGDRPFLLAGADLVVATATAGIFVQPSLGDPQLCVPGWRDDGKPIGAIRAFSRGTVLDNDNDQPVLRTFVYLATEGTGAAPISLYRVELVYR